VTTKQMRSEVVTDGASLAPVSAMGDRGCGAGRLCSPRSAACLSAVNMPRSGCVSCWAGAGARAASAVLCCGQLLRSRLTGVSLCTELAA
jgi:hypothetical protein